ncbi:MAG: flavodoxin family protein [Burkholderiaceae bacterium]
MTQIAVVFHSGYGHTQRVAEHVAKGAQAVLLPIDDDGDLQAAQWAALDAAPAIIFGSPTYMGSVSWQFKKFADDCSKRWISGQWHNKLAAGFTISSNPSGDKLSTLQYMVTLAMQWGMVWVGQTQPNDGRLNRLGAHLGAMAQVPSTSPAGDIPEGDLATAEALGQRVAGLVQGGSKG